MGYNIEISFNMLKHANVSELKQLITDLALDCNCNHYYYLYELEGKCKLPRNHCVIVVNFEDNEIFNCSIFVKQVRTMKKDLYIECIYEDEAMCKLIYASQYYLTTMDKDKVIKYNKFKRERSLSDNEKLILDQIANPLKK
jgi:hypothetical protein